MPAPQHELTDRLVAAVTAKEADTVKALLEAGAAPDTPGPDGLPLLCAAVAGFDYETAEALTDGGADPDRGLPDGTTPVLRAVDLGSDALVRALLGNDPQLRLPEGAQKRLLDLARHWLEKGEEEELRRRTGAVGPATRRLVNDDRYTDVEEVSLGGLTVRAGHSAILTSLEELFGILPPVTELVARAVPYWTPDESHINWSTARYVLGQRQSPQDWSDLKALQHHPDPVHRRFLADVVWSRNSTTWWNQRQDTAQDAEFLAAWALDEPDGMVLARVLEVYAEEDHPDQEVIGLRYADHPDPRVRSQIPNLIPREAPPTKAAATTLLALSRDPDPDVRRSTARDLAAHLTPAFREALLTLIRDSDFNVRAQAVISLGNSDDRTAAVTDALVSLLDEEHQLLRLEIVYALARRDDPRTEQAWKRVGELPSGFGRIGPHQENHRILAYWHYQWRNRPTESDSPTS
ncbi:HEAT repeat domain-containing protein [Streptomyces sp. NPDC029004]|uniref:HEAT repeat domain-containing protein n=1 Tax=Streptomyces sp. NPDC029004 TaxID=3154490 RepID=UPI0033C798A3